MLIFNYIFRVVFILCFILYGCKFISDENIQINRVKNSIDGYYDNKDVSLSMKRYIDFWGQKEPSKNEFYSNFSYYPLKGLEYEKGISRRDPSTIIKVNGLYYVYYTRSQKSGPPVGYKNATKNIPANTWDLCDIYYATSKDMINWQEQGVSVSRGSQGSFDDRSVFTPDIMVYEEKYYLYYQAVSSPFSERSKNVIGMSWANKPEGPWYKNNKPILTTGNAGKFTIDSSKRSHIEFYGDFDSHKVHDPNLIIRNNEIWMYYKAHPMGVGSEQDPPRGVGLLKPYPNFSMGLAISKFPEGPFKKHPLNPVSASGHEALVWPYKEGVATMITANGPEKNTIQWAKDGVNFEVKSHIVLPPDAAGLFCKDKYTNTKNGLGFTWGISHVPQSKSKPWAHLIKFKCDLSQEIDDLYHKTENIRFDEYTRLNSTNR